MASYEGWAIVALMGHNERYGWITEAEQYGTKMIRIDQPVTKDDAGQDVTVTEYYGGPSIYSVRPCAEQIVRDHFASRWSDPRPVQPMHYQPRSLTTDASVDDDDSHMEPDDDDRPF